MNEPKYHPVIFSTDMVRAILDGWKSQTRRVIKQPERLDGLMMAHEEEEWCPYGRTGDRLWVKEAWHSDWEHNRIFYKSDADDNGNVPYLISGAGGCGGGVATAKISKWCRALFMPRRASRIILEIERIRVERVQEISIEDAIAEATDVHCIDCNGTGKEQMPCHKTETQCEFCGGDGRWTWEFRKLWDSLHAKRGYGWDKNPWVWVIEFKRIEEN